MKDKEGSIENSTTIASTPTRNNAGLVLAKVFSRAGEALRSNANG